MNSSFDSRLDALIPVEMARKCEAVGESKVSLGAPTTFVLAILAGAFIALGAVFYTVTITAGEVDLPFGVKKLIGGIAFSLGLVLVVVAGAELFTGNNLIVMAWASKRVSTSSLLKNWIIVYLGNFVGAIGIAAIVSLAQIDQQSNGAVGTTMRDIALSKCSLGWVQAVFAGMGCNILVCLAVWLCMSARSVTDKIAAIILPISAFVATGMEHCVANMYFVPVVMFLDWRSSLTAGSGQLPASDTSAHAFLFRNLFPVTVGNVIGGAVLVGLVYWFVYLKSSALGED